MSGADGSPNPLEMPCHAIAAAICIRCLVLGFSASSLVFSKWSTCAPTSWKYSLFWCCGLLRGYTSHNESEVPFNQNNDIVYIDVRNVLCWHVSRPWLWVIIQFRFPCFLLIRITCYVSPAVIQAEIPMTVWEANSNGHFDSCVKTKMTLLFFTLTFCHFCSTLPSKGSASCNNPVIHCHPRGHMVTPQGASTDSHSYWLCCNLASL